MYKMSMLENRSKWVPLSVAPCLMSELGNRILSDGLTQGGSVMRGYCVGMHSERGLLSHAVAIAEKCRMALDIGLGEGDGVWDLG